MGSDLDLALYVLIVDCLYNTFDKQNLQVQGTSMSLSKM